MYFPVSFGKPAEIAAKISDGKSERGKVAVDERTSLIIYTDYPARITGARQLLTRLDLPTPQVLIEARIVTLTSETHRTLGVNLSFSSLHPPPAGSAPERLFSQSPDSGHLADHRYMVSQLVGKCLLNVDLEIQALQTVALGARSGRAPCPYSRQCKSRCVSGYPGPIPPGRRYGCQCDSHRIQGCHPGASGYTSYHSGPESKNADKRQAGYGLGEYYSRWHRREPGIDTRKIQTELLVDDGNVIVIGGVIDNESTAQQVRLLLGWPIFLFWDGSSRTDNER